MRQTLSTLILLAAFSLTLAACAPGVSEEAIQTGAAETLNAEVTKAIGQSALDTAQAENDALQATNDALLTQVAESPTPEFSATPQDTDTPLPTFTWTPVPATAAPTHAPGISARFEDDIKCDGVRMALMLVRNLGPETYQSAIVIASDSSDTQLGRSDGNSEFHPKASCSGAEPTLGPGEEKYVLVSINGAAAGDTLIVRVTACTEKGFKGNCWSSTQSFIP